MSLSLVFAGLLTPVVTLAAVSDSLILNEANTVSGDKYLDPTKSPGRMDPTFGRVQGNGQNWLEFMVAQGDDLGGGVFKNTLDLRGWKLDWSFDKGDGTSSGSGEMRFTNDPAWAAVPRGTVLTISEWQDAWYSKTADPNDTSTGTSMGTLRGGLPRVGGIDGLGVAKGDPYNAALDYKLGAQLPGASSDPHVLYTDTSWNPAANGGGANGDWHMNFYAGERNPDNSFKYFSFSGSVTKDGVTSAVGTEAGGLFVANNDNWQVTIHDNSSANDGAGNVIEGPLGEAVSGFGGGGINSQEILHFEDDSYATSAVPLPTQANYLSVGNGQLTDGSSSTFGSPSIWSSGSFTQDVSVLRSWLQPGDADLDGTASAADYTIWRDHMGQPGDWRHGDFNGNGIIDMDDYTIWKNNFSGPGGGAAASASVPEPTACLLFVLGVISLIAMRIRSTLRLYTARSN
jgi:hypothetical protein